MSYDSREDTEKHIETVRGFVSDVVGNLAGRSLLHDASKLESPEKEVYDEFTPKLRESIYGSDAYKKMLSDMGPALKHHYENNCHHPEHFSNGISGMTLMDVVEMLCDWKAAGMRHANGSMLQSLEVNRKRFAISDQLYEILVNTAKNLGW